MTTNANATTETTETRTRGAANWERVKALIAEGKCRDCRQERGEGGTRDRCRACARRQNLYRSQRKAATKAPAEPLDPRALTLANGTRIHMTADGSPADLPGRQFWRCKLASTHADGARHRLTVSYGESNREPEIRRVIANVARVAGHTQRFRNLTGPDAGDLTQIDR